MEQSASEALLRAPPCDPVLRTIAPEVDAAFYFARNPDVRAAGMPAAEHYWRTGWREGRDPSPWFSTDDYLRANPDVAAAGINPLWHYLHHGRREGRLPRAPGGPWREELDRPPPVPVAVAAGARRLAPAMLRRTLARACAGARGLVLAVSHDRYTEVRGGTQLLIADEQRKFNGDRAAYLHLSPTVACLGLAPAGDGCEWLGVILDGAWQGVARADHLAAALAGLPADLNRLLVVHALHGWRPETVAALAATLRPDEAVFWAHDYGAGCPGPRLLRNDFAPCAAPPPTSLGCRICRHGEARAAHLVRLRRLFAVVPMRLAAPSAIAAETWLRAAALPVTAVHVHPHVRLQTLPPAPPDPAERDAPVRLAFVGGPDYHKGWSTFRDLLGQARGLRASYRFYQFASPAHLQAMDGLVTVAAETGPASPFGMQRALAAHRIDLVLALSPWPETFSYAAHEALAAGADLIALAGSGHVAALVCNLGRGVVLPDAAALAAFVLGRQAVDYARRRRAEGRASALLHYCGSTATLAPHGQEAMTDDPDLHLLAGGVRIDAEAADDCWRFTLPPCPGRRRTVRLRSRWVATGWDAGGTGDGRRLGVAVASLRVGGHPLDLDHLRGGWHAPEPGLRWTDGDAVVPVGTARTLEVRLTRRLRYWRALLLARRR
jgi:hypothetical protein